MIAKFKPGGRTALFAAITLLVALGCFTFTRASEKAGEPAAIPTTPATGAAAEFLSRIETSQRTIRALEKDLDELTERMEKQQAELDSLRKNLNIPNEIAEGKAVSKVDAETMRQYRLLLADSESQYAKEEVMLKKLREMPLPDVREALPTAAPDTLLNSLLEQLSQAETKLAGLRADLGEEHPDVRNAKAAVANLDKKINERVKGILAGMSVRVDSLKAVVDGAQRKIDEARKEDMFTAEMYRPFFQLKRDLETLQRSRDALMTRLDQEKIDFTVKQSTQGR